MGMWTTAYLAYAIEIPRTDEDVIDEKLSGHTVGVGHLSAGGFDHDKTYLVTACEDAELGKPTGVDLGAHYTDDNPEGRWNQMLDHAAGVLGVEPLGEPGWLLIADVS